MAGRNPEAVVSCSPEAVGRRSPEAVGRRSPDPAGHTCCAFRVTAGSKSFIHAINAQGSRDLRKYADSRGRRFVAIRIGTGATAAPEATANLRPQPEDADVGDAERPRHAGVQTRPRAAANPPRSMALHERRGTSRGCARQLRRLEHDDVRRSGIRDPRPGCRTKASARSIACTSTSWSVHAARTRRFGTTGFPASMRASQCG